VCWNSEVTGVTLVRGQTQGDDLQLMKALQKQANQAVCLGVCWSFLAVVLMQIQCMGCPRGDIGKVYNAAYGLS
jgi:hypothetical protein